MKKKGVSEIIRTILIVLIVMSMIIMVWAVIKGNIGYYKVDSYVTLNFPKSNSTILSEYNQTYLAGEEVFIELIPLKRYSIQNIQINGKNASFDYGLNGTFSLRLDTVIRDKNSKETKIISITGMTTTGGNFTKEENYEVVMSTEEFLFKQTKQIGEDSKKANTFAFWALVIAGASIFVSIILFIVNQIISYKWINKKK